MMETDGCCDDGAIYKLHCGSVAKNVGGVYLDPPPLRINLIYIYIYIERERERERDCWSEYDKKFKRNYNTNYL